MEGISYLKRSGETPADDGRISSGKSALPLHLYLLLSFGLSPKEIRGYSCCCLFSTAPESFL